MNKVCTVEQAIALIKDGDCIVNSSFILAGTAESLMRGIEESYLSTKHPKNLTLVFAGSAGKGAAGMGHDHFAHTGDSGKIEDNLVGKVIGGHFGLAPTFNKYMVSGNCLAYNYPLGVMTGIYRAAAQNRSFELSKVGLNTFVDPRIEGGKINSVTMEDIIEVVDFDGEEWLRYSVPHFDIALIRATTADPEGNVTIDHEVCKLDMKNIAMAVHAHGGKVIVQVKDLAQSGTLTADKVEIPGVLVDAVVVCPDPETEHRQTTGYFYDKSMSGHINVPVDAIPALKLDIRKVIARRCAMELVPNAVINLGIGMPELVAVVANEEGFGDQLTMTTESGIMGGIPCNGGAFGAGQNAAGYFDMRSMFDFYDGGGLDLAVLGLAECNSRGDINVSRFGTRVPGAGGFINISQNTHKVVFCGTFTAGGLEAEVGDGKLRIVSEGTNKKFVKEVQQVSFASQFANDHGQEIIYVTERAVFKLMPEGLTLIELAPGIDVQKNIYDQMDFKPLVSPELKEMDASIFAAEKMGLDIS